jgi:hypothetical protein
MASTRSKQRFALFQGVRVGNGGRKAGLQPISEEEAPVQTLLAWRFEPPRFRLRCFFWIMSPDTSSDSLTDAPCLSCARPPTALPQHPQRTPLGPHPFQRPFRRVDHRPARLDARLGLAFQPRRDLVRLMRPRRARRLTRCHERDRLVVARHGRSAVLDGVLEAMSPRTIASETHASNGAAGRRARARRAH